MNTFEQWISKQAGIQPDKTAIIYRPANENTQVSGQKATSQKLTYFELEQLINRTTAVLKQHYQLKSGQRVAWLGLNHPQFFILLAAASRLDLIVIPLNWRLSLDELSYAIKDSQPELLLHDNKHISIACKLSELIEAFHPDQEHKRLCNFESVHQSEHSDSLTELQQKHCHNISTDFDHGNVMGNPVKTSKTNKIETTSKSLPVQPDNPDNPLLLVYTSGTTGRPKGALLPQKSVICNAKMSQHMLGLSADDVVLNVLPLFHVGGINIQSLPALMHGATLVLHQSFEPQATLQSLKQHGITLVLTVPTIQKALFATGAWRRSNFPSLRSVAIGSTHVPPTLIEKVQAGENGLPLIQVYGATETGPIAIYQTEANAIATAGSIGKCGILCEVALRNTNNEEVAAGEVGEICIKGDNIFSGYWNNDSASKEALHDGWFRSGDMASIDENGNYWFQDRKKHVIISGGENIYPAEIERVLDEIPHISESTVVGVKDEKWGEVPVALLVESAPVTDAEIMSTCRDRLAAYKQPRKIGRVKQLPRNAMGKVVVADARVLAEELCSNPG